MFMYLRLILTLALLSVVAHPSVAQDARPSDPTELISGLHGEEFELVLLLVSGTNDGKTNVADCELSAKFQVFDPVDPIRPIYVQSFALTSEDPLVILSFQFATVAGKGERGQVFISISESRTSGFCDLLSSASMVDIKGITTPGFEEYRARLKVSFKFDG